MNATKHLCTKNTLVALAILFFIAAPALSFAASAGTDPGTGTGASGAFDQLYTMVKELLSGSLGKLLTILALGVALIVAVKVQSVIGILGAFAIALAAVYGPAVLETLFTASLPIAELSASLPQIAMPPADAPSLSACVHFSVS